MCGSQFTSRLQTTSCLSRTHHVVRDCEQNRLHGGFAPRGQPRRMLTWPVDTQARHGVERDHAA
eukprot:11222889-Lingulodinium_polyedra.AAC.1